MENFFASKDYDRFRPHPNQREIREHNVKKLMDSMKTEGFMKCRPILVNQNNLIFDGHHRLLAAKALKIDFYVLVDPDLCKEHLIHLNEQTPWTNKDYVDFWAKDGNESYLKMKRLSDKYKMTPNSIIRCFDLVESKDNSYRKGRLHITEETYSHIDTSLGKVQDVVDFLLEKRPDCFPITRSSAFKVSLAIFLSSEKVHFSIFMSRFESQLQRLHRCSTANDYVEVWIDFYNYRAKGERLTRVDFGLR